MQKNCDEKSGNCKVEDGSGTEDVAGTEPKISSNVQASCFQHKKQTVHDAGVVNTNKVPMTLVAHLMTSSLS